MAVIGTALPDPPQIHRIPQSKYVDAVRWLPQFSAFDRFVVLALFDDSSDSPSSIEIHSLDTQAVTLSPQSTWAPPSRVSSLKTSQTRGRKPLIAAGTVSGSLHLLLANAVDASLESEFSVAEEELHVGRVSCVDVMEGGGECVSVGEDGRVNLASVAGSELSFRRFFDSQGLVSYTSVKWASPAEFVTGGYGFSLQWWDQRKPGGAASQLKGNWARGMSGIVQSIDIHPSRKHTCLAGGSLGTVFAWDLRWQQQPIILSGIGGSEDGTHPACESEVWEVQYDRHTKSTNTGNISSSRVLPAMICSEDGILAVVGQDAEPIELLAEPCAINSFDIDRENPSDVICSLEWESIVLLTRP
ncbi:nuclear pore complex protein NUP43 [Juglans microcarpa x Juglans regia]|uniref:nuclear pore complex protein NUP43 n=1 Tax=Juglans microcarpa x Juglans regia TaxID=2249226 RepID=UPI001B7F4FE5|nr:nuclear pore complex protein NUP43 [Juglans microcarpa x Juglans regia]